jgi:hypothetical protein
VAVAVLLGIAAVPAWALAQPRWYRGSKTEVTVYVERTRVGAANWSSRRKTACHELGHALGHRRTGRTCMRDGFATMYGHPDATDHANLRALYRRP